MSQEPVETPAPRTHAERSKATREHLIATAIEVVRQRSYQGATVFEVAKAAGVTPGALQHHFGSKAVLMMQVVDEILRSSDAGGVQWPGADLPLEQRASRYVHALWERVYEPPRFLAAWSVYFGSSTDPELRAHIAGRRAVLDAALHARFVAIFPEAARTPGVEPFVDLVLSSLRGIGLVRLFDADAPQCAAQLEVLAMLIVQRCTAAAVPPRSPTPPPPRHRRKSA